MEKLSFNDFKNIIKNEGRNLFYVGRDDCRDCVKFMPVLQEVVVENNVKMYYLDIKQYRLDAIKEDASESDKVFYDDLVKMLNIDWVPMCVAIENEKVVSKYQFLNTDHYLLTEEEQEKNVLKFINLFIEWINEFK